MVSRKFFVVSLVLYLICEFQLGYSSQNSLKKVRMGGEVYYSNITLINNMPYWKNNLSYQYGSNFLLACKLKRFSKISLNASLGVGYRDYFISVPDLNYLFLWYKNNSPFDHYKNIRLRYLNFPLSYSFTFLLNKQVSIGIGQTFNLLYMPKQFYLNEGYVTGVTGVTHTQQPYIQYNHVDYQKRELVPNTTLSFNISANQNGYFNIRLSKCLTMPLLQIGSSSSNEPDNNKYYYRSPYDVTLFTQILLFSGVNIDVSYKYYF